MKAWARRSKCILFRPFVEHDAYRCGYCTVGQIMSAAAMLHETWGPGAGDVRAYLNITAAVQEVRKKSSS